MGSTDVVNVSRRGSRNLWIRNRRDIQLVVLVVVIKQRGIGFQAPLKPSGFQAQLIRNKRLRLDDGIQCGQRRGRGVEAARFHPPSLFEKHHIGVVEPVLRSDIIGNHVPIHTLIANEVGGRAVAVHRIRCQHNLFGKIGGID